MAESASSSEGHNRAYRNASPSSVHLRRLPHVEKDADDTNHPPTASPSTERQANTTFTTLTRLLGAASLSPEASRASSYINSIQQHGYIRNISVKETAALPDHLFTRGLCEGRHSDIAVHAFGTRYKLHRIVLDRAPFFATALSGPWLEAKSSEITIRPEEIDTNITQHGFELALKRLYRGVADVEEEDRHAVELFATGCWLEMPDLIEASIDSILRQMSTDTLGFMITLVTKNYYGRSGDKILASCKAMLCRDGWRMPSRYWDSVPADIVQEIVSSDGFYVRGEWERWLLSKRITNRRLRARAIEDGLLDSTDKKSKAENVKAFQAIRPLTTTYLPTHLAAYATIYMDREILPLLDLLDGGIHYVHLDFEQLQDIRTARDALGFPILPDKVISNALWQQMELRQRVVNSSEPDLELGLAVEVPARASQLSSRPAHQRPELKHQGGPNDPRQPLSTHLEQAESESCEEPPSVRQYWIPSTDCNIVMGGNSDPVISISQNGGSPDGARQRGPDNTRHSMDKDSETEHAPACYSNLPPFRFSAEFPSPKLLKEKKRAYSRTVFYAGSLWNIYIQKVASARSTKQLGVYLHRVKDRENEEAMAAAAAAGPGLTQGRLQAMAIPDWQRAAQRQRQQRQTQDAGQRTHWDDDDSSADAAGSPSETQASDGVRRSLRSSRTTFQSTASSGTGNTMFTPSEDNDDSDSETDTELRAIHNLQNAHPIPTLPSYNDLRPTIKTYFKIYSPSRGGRMLSVYESAPDKFNFSQSWGWKSSTLMLDEGLLSQDESDHMNEAAAGRDEEAVNYADGSNLKVASSKEQGNGRKIVNSLGDGKLRFMVVIGIL